ncbi:hypothetical protein BKA70DRAFT_1570753 [Coprinopsis sp. MPI-PUGE-AT-0042]|nr:hypothetical protein BKA70DRAFT_1570753 [Coprinopsis sp. MPI-PUGE-AT-0042]
MNTTDMLTQARTASATANSGQETAGTCLANDFSPTVESMTLEELDIGGSEFSWSSVGSGPSQPSPDALAVTFKGTPGEELAVAKGTPPSSQPSVSTGTPTENAPAPSMQKHSLYFWDSITFKVEGVVFQLPKYRFVEDSEVFTEMVAKDGPIDLDVAPVDFESFLKAFLPRASAMYDNRPMLSKEEWISVLKLSTKWLFNDLRQLAISHLSSPFPWLGPIMDPIEYICLAKEYNVYNWLLDGYREVIHRLLTVDDAGGSPMTLTAQEGKRIGMDVALELSGIAIRRMRLAKRKAPLRDVRSDVLDVFKEELYRVREEGVRFMTRSERLEEAIRKAEEEARGQAEEEDKERQKEVEEEMAKRILEVEAEKEKERALKEAEMKKEADLELEFQANEERRKAQSEEIERQKREEAPTATPYGRLSEEEGTVQRVITEKEASQPRPREEDTRLSVAEDSGCFKDEEAKRLEEEEEINKLKVEIAKRLEEEDVLRRQEKRKQKLDEKDETIQALAEEELRRRSMSASTG